MTARTQRLFLRRALAALSAAVVAPAPVAAQNQNPSPMTETTRAHERLQRMEIPGRFASFAGPATREVDVFVPASFDPRGAVTVVLHFHGAAWIPQQAVAGLPRNALSAVVNLGAGSTRYDRELSAPHAFEQLLEGIQRTASELTGSPVRADTLVLTAFSAGHGAVRAILRNPAGFERVDAVLLLDGMHTSYVPDGAVLAEGGRLEASHLLAFAAYGRASLAGSKRLLITHSEIFPGTFASTTETADWLLTELGLRRTAVLKWGPRGMQQLSEVSSGAFELHGYAGNSAPDHVDHFHAMPELLTRLLR